MKFKFTIAAILALAMSMLCGCSKTKSYAELLTDENKATNAFLANQVVEMELPADNAFVTVEEAGDDAPYYMIEPEGNVYMQVVSKGDGEMVESNEIVCFVFLRYDLLSYYKNGCVLPEGWGNGNDKEQGNFSFRYENYTLTSSALYGKGIQLPLQYLPYGSHVNLVVKSTFGWSDSMGQCVPFLYDIIYNPPKSI